MTVGELRKLLDGLEDDVPVVLESYDGEEASCEYGPAFAQVTTMIRLARRKRDRWDEWLPDEVRNMEGRARQPRTRVRVLLVQP